MAKAQRGHGERYGGSTGYRVNGQTLTKAQYEKACDISARAGGNPAKAVRIARSEGGFWSKLFGG